MIVDLEITEPQMSEVFETTEDKDSSRVFCNWDIQTYTKHVYTFVTFCMMFKPGKLHLPPGILRPVGPVST